MLENRLTGRIFNSYECGGYLIYRLHQQNQVYIDGRTSILYPIEFYRHYREVALNPPLRQRELATLGVEYVIWAHTRGIMTAMDDDPDFSLEFMDQRYALFSRGASKLKRTGRLYVHPEEWNAKDIAPAVAEAEWGLKHLPKQSPIYPMLALLSTFARAANKDELLDVISQRPPKSARLLRLLAHMTEVSHPPISLRFLQQLTNRQISDYLLAARLMIHDGQWLTAEELLVKAWRKWKSVSDEDRASMAKLLDGIRSKNGLHMFRDHELASIFGSSVESGGQTGPVDDDEIQTYQ